jgi:hypothetical protein
MECVLEALPRNSTGLVVMVVAFILGSVALALAGVIGWLIVADWDVADWDDE